MSLSKQILILLAVAAIAFTCGRFMGPASETISKSKEIETHQSENIDRNQNYVEVTRETHRPDGTVIKEVRKEKDTTTKTEKEKSADTKQSLVQVTENRPGYRLGVQYEPAIRSFQSQGVTVVLERRLFSEVYVGLTGSNRKTVGISFSLGF